MSEIDGNVKLVLQVVSRQRKDRQSVASVRRAPSIAIKARRVLLLVSPARLASMQINKDLVSARNAQQGIISR